MVRFDPRDDGFFPQMGWCPLLCVTFIENAPCLLPENVTHLSVLRIEVNIRSWRPPLLYKLSNQAFRSSATDAAEIFNEFLPKGPSFVAVRIVQHALYIYNSAELVT